LPLNWQLRIPEGLDSGQPREAEIQVDGTYFSLLLAPVIELEYVNIYARDVTDARVASAEARQHQTELVHVCRLSTMGEMATGLAHELNQPLAAIVNYANGTRRRLEMGQISTTELEEPLNQITRQAARAGDIIRRLRALVSRQPAQRRPVDANSMVQEVLSFLEYEIDKFGVTLETDLHDNLPAVRADLVQIEQVVLNLIRNAVDAVKDNPAGERRVWLETMPSSQGGVSIRVRDNGPGLSAEIRGRLFEPFFSTKATGMGMGLAISQTIARDHGGRISVWDVEGPGAVFTLALPAMFQQESAVAS
jgi:C4-dicarboxylate-specific signal transduction histidine kinase